MLDLTCAIQTHKSNGLLQVCATEQSQLGSKRKVKKQHLFITASFLLLIYCISHLQAVREQEALIAPNLNQPGRRMQTKNIQDREREEMKEFSRCVCSKWKLLGILFKNSQ